jgi:hypothetical protein
MTRQRPPICRVFAFMEIWKKVEGFEDYKVSNLGRVKSLKFGKEKILKTLKNKRGYIVVNFRCNNKTKLFKVHQLVAMAFLGHKPCGMKLVIDHINDITYDNRVENLQIITQRANVFKTQGKYTSQYKGVQLYNYSNKWLANIRINQKLINLGLFKTEIEASEAYQQALKSFNNNEEIIVKKNKKISKLKGIYWHKRFSKFQAIINIDGKLKFLGNFNTEEEAIEVYKNKLAEIQ